MAAIVDIRADATGAALGRRSADPRPDGVVAAGQVPGVVGVEALDPGGCRRRRRWDGARRGPRDGGVALVGVPPWAAASAVGVDLGLGRPHPTRGLEPATQRALGLADQPVAGGHRRPVVEQRALRITTGEPSAWRTTTSQ